MMASDRSRIVGRDRWGCGVRVGPPTEGGTHSVTRPTRIRWTAACARGPFSARRTWRLRSSRKARSRRMITTDSRSAR
jgi:hypothetical protein